jgi:hypothetical protein
VAIAIALGLEPGAGRPLGIGYSGIEQVSRRGELVDGVKNG